MKEFYDIESTTARLSNIEALNDCIHNEITQNYFDKHSFGIEFLHALTFILNEKFPRVKHVSLTDASYIPCNRSPVETLDLLIYSIALHGLTWYEKMLNARVSNAGDHERYIKAADLYISHAAKDAFTFDSMAKTIIGGGSAFAKQQIVLNMAKWENYYNMSRTFPDFFQKLAKDVGRRNKCKFFKGWLQGFIESYVPIYLVHGYLICLLIFPRLKKIGLKK